MASGCRPAASFTPSARSTIRTSPPSWPFAPSPGNSVVRIRASISGPAAGERPSLHQRPCRGRAPERLTRGLQWRGHCIQVHAVLAVVRDPRVFRPAPSMVTETGPRAFRYPCRPARPRILMGCEPSPSGPPKPRLLDRVRGAVRARHYSRRTEEAYVTWIKRYIFFHDKRHPAEMGGPEVTAFLTFLAVAG